MSDPLSTISTLITPQSVSADPQQIENSAGGYTFVVEPMTLLRRFLTLGTAGGTYYVSEKDLTRETAGEIIEIVRRYGLAAVDEIIQISTFGRAPKPNAALFTLAIAAAAADEQVRTAALAALPSVARTGTHLFLFARYVEQFRGWGRGLRRAVGRWYTEKDVDPLAYQLVKYQQREGWSHRDLLRLAHPASENATKRALFDWVCDREPTVELPPVVRSYQAGHRAGADIVKLVESTPGFSWEMLPSESLADPAVWRALLAAGLPMTALIRQLPRLTQLGLCDPMSDTAALIAAQLTNADRLIRARVHPISILVALRTYASGRSVRGAGTWEPSSVIVDALDRAFYLAFGSVAPSGKRTLLAWMFQAL